MEDMNDLISRLQSTCNKLATSCNQLATDFISRQGMCDSLNKYRIEKMLEGKDVSLVWECIDKVLQEPSVQPDVHDRNVGEWDMFDLITSTYYGKGMYFKQDNGIVYSRYSGKYMWMDEAINEFLALIGGELG